MRNIFLTGFMAVGKSEVGAILAKKLDMIFIDTDRLIEAKTNKTIPELFKSGEDGFREIEAEVVETVATGENKVVALGGGALLKQNSRLKILGSGDLIYLCASATTILERLERAGVVRPVLEPYGKVEKLEVIKKLLEERGPIYQLAQLMVHTDGKIPDEVAHEIILKFGVK